MANVVPDVDLYLTNETITSLKFHIELLQTKLTPSVVAKNQLPSVVVCPLDVQGDDKDFLTPLQ